MWKNVNRRIFEEHRKKPMRVKGNKRRKVKEKRNGKIFRNGRFSRRSERESYGETRLRNRQIFRLVLRQKQGGRGITNRIVIGKDTRRSSYMFEYALAAGLTASGADAYLLHVTTTPSVAYVARVDRFDCGVMISASHNPFTDNGIKLINGAGMSMWCRSRPARATRSTAR